MQTQPQTRITIATAAADCGLQWSSVASECFGPQTRRAIARCRDIFDVLDQMK
jgi:hypothetical protein